MAERSDLSKKLPDETAKLEKKLTEYLKTVDAHMPTPNAKYDPNATPTHKKKKDV